MRGNHDDPKYFCEQLPKFNINQDYEIMDKILIVVRAISIDRMFRVNNRDYWVDDQYIDIEINMK